MYATTTRRFDDYYARVEGFGRLYFDKCATDEEHLLNTEIPEGDDRPRCRIYADEVVPKGTLNQKGVWIVKILFDDGGPEEGLLR